MANLTVVVDSEVLQKARIRALKQGTSVNRLVQRYLEAYAGAGGSPEILAGFLEVAKRSTASSGPEGRTWRREDLYE